MVILSLYDDDLTRASAVRRVAGLCRQAGADQNAAGGDPRGEREGELVYAPGPRDGCEDAEQGNVTVSAAIRLFYKKGTPPSTRASARKRRSVRWPVLATSPLPSASLYAGCSPPPKGGGTCHPKADIAFPRTIQGRQHHLADVPDAAARYPSTIATRTARVPERII